MTLWDMPLWVWCVVIVVAGGIVWACYKLVDLIIDLDLKDDPWR